MKKFYAVLDKLISNPSTLNLGLINNLLKFGIPFNAPHGFKIKKLIVNNTLV